MDKREKAKALDAKAKKKSASSAASKDEKKKDKAASSATSATSLAQLRGQPKKGAGGKEEKAPGGGGGERGGKASRGGGGGALPSEAGGGGYLGDMDLPPSDSESDDATDPSAAEARRAERDLAALSLATAKDAKRAAERERKASEKMVREKQAALRDDDDSVFDVSFERVGGAGAAAAGGAAGGAADDVGGTVSATDIKVQNLTIRAKGKVLLDRTTLTVTAGRRYGLAGPNGKGKSTLLRMIARRQVPVPEGLDVLLVEQEIVGDDRTALAAVVAADAKLMRLRAEEAEIAARAEGEGGGGVDAATADADGERLAEIYEEMEHLGGGGAEARASKILHGLGFTQAMQKRATRDFSGGWRMRISLARALYIQPTLLLLDEPTNHLDLRAVLWLEEYLSRWKKSLIVVSHDRGFLNAITTDVIHLHDERLHYYRGNFESFEEMYDQRRAEANKAADKFDKAMKAAKRSGGGKAAQEKVVKGAKAAAKGKGGGARGKKGGNDDDLGPSASGKDNPDAPRRWQDYTVTFKFPEPTELSSTQLLSLRDAGFSYPGRDDFALSGLNIGIGMGSRVAVVGPNGAGKTTLMNLLAGDLEPTTGEQRRSPSLRVGRYAQHFVDALQMEDTPVEYLLGKFSSSTGLRAEQARAQLGRFGLAGHHHLQPICKLSGGQKARVVFTAISLSNPHVLLLDEPTNHLDMQSIDALSEALAAFEGGVVVISHDAQLLQRVCDDDERAEVWLVENGGVEKFDGYFEDYRDSLLKEISAELEEDEKEEAAAARRKAEEAAARKAKKGGAGGGGRAAAAPAAAKGEEEEEEEAFVNPLISNPALLKK